MILDGEEVRDLYACSESDEEGCEDAYEPGLDLERILFHVQKG